MARYIKQSQGLLYKQRCHSFVDLLSILFLPRLYGAVTPKQLKICLLFMQYPMKILNLKTAPLVQSCPIGSAILLNGWILLIGGVALESVQFFFKHKKKYVV